jgi:3-deoxy-D-manno-octulosonic-acid transferase
MRRNRRLKTKGIYLLYRGLEAVGLPFLLLYFLIRGFRDARYFRSLRERFGFLPASFQQTAPGAIWLHAVSVGEVISLEEFVRQLRAEIPDAPVFVSTSTLAGRATAMEKLTGVAAGVFYAPVDYVFAVRRVLRRLRPSVVIVAETEIWPNLFREVKRTRAALLIVNGRISDRAAPRYLRFAWFFRHALKWPDVILAQSEAIRELFARIGAPPDRVEIGGNLKYDFQPQRADAGSPVVEFLGRARPDAIWIAASTMPPAEPGDVDEDDAVIRAFQELMEKHPGLLLMLVPRKPERFDLVARKLEAAGIDFVRRSSLKHTSAGVLLLDSMGELSGLFFLADVVFMGGTLARRGGHNILEPAFFARPVIVGPHMENFRVIAGEFRAAGAVVDIASAAELAPAVDSLLTDRDLAAEIGRRALAWAEARRGATRKAVEHVRRLYDHCLPVYRSAWFLLLWPLAQLWILGGRWRRTRGLARRRALDVPVVSVGNLAMGGTGKTPIVLHLAAELKSAGHRPGILTRGYGRHSPEKHIALPAGATVPVAHSGDEPQMFLRAAVAPVGIGPDRYLTGKLMEQQFGVDVLILDDGFQHLQLARQVDIVLIDALDPFRSGHVFPLGRLREPMEELRRADLFIITRSDYGRALTSIENELRRHNARAPIFHSRIVPEKWVEHWGGRSFPCDELPYRRAGAFCGLGNPQSFWHSLDALGVRVVDQYEFADHHIYRPREMANLAEHFRAVAADVIVTTEKDIFNLCDGCEDLFAPLPLFWLKIRAELDREAEFLLEIERRLEAQRVT